MRSGGGSAGPGEGSGGAKAAKKRAGNGWGAGWDNVVGAHAGSRDAVTVKADESTLPRRTIGGVVARSAGRLRFCYEDGLRREAGLAGQIPVNFTVDLRGNVVVATDGGSTVADPTVVRCVLSTFAAMTFPARASGSAVRASYLVTFPPG